MEIDEVVEQEDGGGFRSLVDTSKLGKICTDYSLAISQEASIKWEVYMEELGRMSVLKLCWAIHTWIYPCTWLLYANSTALFTPQCKHLSDSSEGAVGESFYLI